jgi:VIT1/CCC1 family predicted Fe2+/Mn2+ transporter
VSDCLALARSQIFLVDCVVTLVTMFLLGVTKAKVTNTNPIGQGSLMMLNGAIACGAGYLIAMAIAEIMGDPEAQVGGACP